MAAFKYSGTRALQWPHQGAKNSTIQTASLCSTSLSKFEAVKLTTSELDGYNPWTADKSRIKTPEI